MPSNGVAVRLAPEPTHATPSTGKTALGAAVADAVVGLYQAIFDQQRSGALSQATKDAGAGWIARIALLQLDHELGDDDFFRRAHEQGKCELHRLFSANVFQRYAPGEVDMVFDTAIDSVFEIVTKVVKDERVFRAAWAH